MHRASSPSQSPTPKHEAACSSSGSDTWTTPRHHLSIRKTCKQIQLHTMNTSFTKCGFNRKWLEPPPLDIYGVWQHYHLYLEQRIQHVLTLIKHLHTPGPLQSLLQISLQQYQLLILLPWPCIARLHPIILVIILSLPCDSWHSSVTTQRMKQSLHNGPAPFPRSITHHSKGINCCCLFLEEVHSSATSATWQTTKSTAMHVVWNQCHTIQRC